MNNNQNPQPIQDSTPQPSAGGSRFSPAAIATLVFSALMILCCFLPFFSVKGISVSLFQCIFGTNQMNSLDDLAVYAVYEAIRNNGFAYLCIIFVLGMTFAAVAIGLGFILRKKHKQFKSTKATITIAGLIIIFGTLLSWAVLALSSHLGVGLGFGGVFLLIFTLAFDIAITKCMPKKPKKK